MFPAAPFPQLLVSPAHSGGEDTAAEDEAELADTTEAAATDTDTDGLATSTSYTTEDKQVQRRNILKLKLQTIHLRCFHNHGEGPNRAYI